MRFTHFFIDRPIFAAVVSIVFVILGGVSFARLPIAQYPEIAPPIINVSGQYHPDRAADQRRREHDLHVVELDG
jgi:multidrug efflux pump subunit AcrB